MTRLYYEAHITVKPNLEIIPLHDWHTFREWAEAHDFRASRFDVDEVDHYDGAWFLSNRSTNLEEMKDRINYAVNILTQCNYKVLRWKIEDTLLDSKYGDTL